MVWLKYNPDKMFIVSDPKVAAVEGQMCPAQG